MKYYSTGIGSHLPKRGTPVECTNENTVKILLERGFIVESVELLEAPAKIEVVEEVKTLIVEAPIGEQTMYPEGAIIVDGMDYPTMKSMVAKLGLKTNGVTFPALKKALNDYNKTL